MYIGEFFNNKYHGKGILEKIPVSPVGRVAQVFRMSQVIPKFESEIQDFFAGELEKEIFYFLYEGQK